MSELFICSLFLKLQIWQNEKVSPELMTSHSDLVALIQSELSSFEARAKTFPKGDVRTQLILLQVTTQSIPPTLFVLTDLVNFCVLRLSDFGFYSLTICECVLRR